MTTTESSTRLTVGGREMAIRHGGEGPPIVFLHGWPVSGVYWNNLIPHLQPDYHWILVDLPGFGTSEVPEGPLTIAAQAGRIGALLEALDLSEVTLVGHSMGGMIACCLAATAFQSRLARLVAVSAPIWGPGGAYWDLRLGSLPLVRRIVVYLMRYPALRRLVSTRFAPGIVIDEGLLTSTDQATDDVVMATARGLLSTDLRPLLDRIQIPTLVIYGELDRIVTPSQPLMTLARLPEARLEVYPDTGHCPSLERPDRFIESLRRFTQN